MEAQEAEMEGKKGENEHFCQAVIQSTWQDWRQWIPTECMETNVNNSKTMRDGEINTLHIIYLFYKN